MNAPERIVFPDMQSQFDSRNIHKDLVRDVALALEREPRVLAYVVEAENFESIHNHSAFARVVSQRDRDSAGAPAAARQRNLRQLPMGGTA